MDYTQLRRWSNMMQRCYDPACSSYKNYGARGITVCDRWHVYSNFVEDMGAAPSGMSIDRIDNDGPYSPENTRWADRYTQANNKSNNRKVEYKGRTQTIGEWARELGIVYKILHQRLRKCGWDMKVAMNPQPPEWHGKFSHDGQTHDVGAITKRTGLSRTTIKYRIVKGMIGQRLTAKHNGARPVEYNGEVRSIAEWARFYNVDASVLRGRLNAGWSFESAVETEVKRPVVYTHEGDSATLPEWAQRMGINPFTIHSRLANGASFSEAVSKPVRKKGILITAFGKSMSLNEWSSETGIEVSTLRRRMKLGWSHEDVVSRPIGNNAGKAKDITIS